MRGSGESPSGRQAQRARRTRTGSWTLAMACASGVSTQNGRGSPGDMPGEPLFLLLENDKHNPSGFDVPEHFREPEVLRHIDRKSTRLNSSHMSISYAVFC